MRQARLKIGELNFPIYYDVEGEECIISQSPSNAPRWKYKFILQNGHIKKVLEYYWFVGDIPPTIVRGRFYAFASQVLKNVKRRKDLEAGRNRDQMQFNFKEVK